MLCYTDAKDFGGRLMSRLTISIFTPTHRTKYLLEAYDSIQSQDYDEWVIYPNAGATVGDIPEEIIADNRTVIINPGAEFTPKLAGDGLPNIGSVKKYVCSKCKGDILVEFDHDDLMVPPAIDRVREAFEDPDVVFAYSNTADFNSEDHSPRFYGNANAETNYDSANDWVYRNFYYKDVLYKEAICPEPTPYHASLIWFAPNHFRAFRKSVYDRIGGHNEDLATLDDQDLMCRLYLEGKFAHINECLYLYRVDGNNSWLVRNEALQETKWEIQKQYIYQMIIHHAKVNGYRMLDLGGRFNCPEEFISVDLRGAAINCDLNKRFPFEDSSVGVIRAFDIIEHLSNKNHTMSEIHRVLRPGGYALINVPSTEGNGAHMDPSHVTFWNEGSFLYYTDRNSAQYIDNTTVRFKPVTLFTHYPNEWCQRYRIAYVSTVLICLKDSYRPHGELAI